MKNPLFPFGERLYRKLGPVLGRKRNPRLCRVLSQLYPSEDIEKVYDRFQIGRLSLVFAVLIMGIVSAAVLPLCSKGEGLLAEGGRLFRNEWDAGEYRVMLQAKTESWSGDIPFVVKERELSGEEREDMLRGLTEELSELIKGDNAGLNAVTRDLSLPASVNGYPFRLTWSSENSRRISSNGKVDRTGLEDQGEWIRLTVRISYGEESSDHVYDVFLLPEEPGREERLRRRLEEELKEADFRQRSSRELQLPDTLMGEKLEWKEKKAEGQAAAVVLALTLLCVVLICRGMENDLERSCKKRNRQLLADYPEFVSKLRLYLSAGLTVKNALFRMLADYREQQLAGKERYLYQEIKLACYQMENGVAEEQAYQEFGRRCGEMRYRRLSFLLSVHLKQGNKQLLTLLSQEADNAQEDRRGMARKAGEEAGTKLLLPMMLMMVVVMFLVLLPAYMGFGNV